jgi:hypothetical protein
MGPDPTLTRIIWAMTAEHVVDLVDELCRQCPVLIASGPSIQSQVVADREGIGPQVAPRRGMPGDPRRLREFVHQLLCKFERHRRSSKSSFCSAIDDRKRVRGFVLPALLGRQRPNDGHDHLPPATKDPPAEAETLTVDEVVCRERFGELLVSHDRQAA